MWMTLAWGQIKNARYFRIDVKTSPTLIQAPPSIYFIFRHEGLTHTHAAHPARPPQGEINYNSPSAFTHDYYVYVDIQDIEVYEC